MILYTRGRQSDLHEIDGRLVDVFLDERLRKCVFFVLADVPRHGLIEREIVGTGF